MAAEKWVDVQALAAHLSVSKGPQFDKIILNSLNCHLDNVFKYLAANGGLVYRVEHFSEY